MAWYVRTAPPNGELQLWWSGQISNVLTRRSNQQWSRYFDDATPYVDRAEAVAAYFVLGAEDMLTVDGHVHLESDGIAVVWMDDGLPNAEID